MTSDKEHSTIAGHGAGELGRPRMLIVENDEPLRETISRLFREDYEVHEASDGATGLELALRIEPAVVIADQRMPQIRGVELLQQVKEALPETVRILITGLSEYRPVIDAVNAAGIHQYFEKPFHPHQLRTAIDALVGRVQLQRHRDQLLIELNATVAQLAAANAQLEAANAQLANKEAQLAELVEARTAELHHSNQKLKELNKQLREMALRDGLTGLYNHRYLMEHLQLEVARAKRYQRIFSLLFADLDGFKAINDQHGHQVGDAVLSGVAKLVSQGPRGLRCSDISARYGGEEFCIVLPETPIEGARVTAERVRAAVESRDWTQDGLPPEQRVTISIGVACFPEHGTDANALLRAADNALYEAKKSGKNQVVICRQT